VVVFNAVVFNALRIGKSSREEQMADTAIECSPDASGKHLRKVVYELGDGYNKGL
jgi:hypothetical protein